LPNTIIVGGLTGNDFSTLINLGLGDDIPGNVGQTVTSNPTPLNIVNIGALLVLDLRTGKARAVWGENSAGTTYVKDFVKDPFSTSWGGKLLKDGLDIAARAKIIWDAGATLRAIYVCAPVAAGQ
jgi:hypothetical protein